jgi:hypothetical protein
MFVEDPERSRYQVAQKTLGVLTSWVITIAEIADGDNLAEKRTLERVPNSPLGFDSIPGLHAAWKHGAFYCTMGQTGDETGCLHERVRHCSQVFCSVV